MIICCRKHCGTVDAAVGAEFVAQFRLAGVQRRCGAANGAGQVRQGAVFEYGHDGIGSPTEGQHSDALLVHRRRSGGVGESLLQTLHRSGVGASHLSGQVGR